MFTALVQVFKSGGMNGTAGTPNFLRDISDLVERTEWTDIMVGGLQDATFEMQLQYEDTTDLLGGNWIIYGCRGGSLHAAVAAGAGSIVVDDATDDPVRQGVPGAHEFAVGDAILISNGVDTDLMLVSAVSYSGTQATLTLGSAPGQGTSTLLNAYGAGSVVARLQFQGIITSRQRTTEWTNKYALRALGMGWRYNNVIASFDIEAQDSATSILQIIEQYASTVPEVIVNAANFAAANGIMYTGTSNGAQPVMQVLTDILRTESGGATTQTPNEASFWAFWVDALRQAHHQKVKTDIPSPATPTYVIDLLTGNAYGDVCGAVTPTDMDMSQLLNTVLVMGGKGSDGNQVEIIVTNSSSITEYGHYEGTLSNPNITDQNALALWASGIIGVRGWPRETSRLSLTVDSCRMTARDQLGVTGFTDGSELVTNPVEIRRQADAKQRIVTSMITLSQMQPDMTSLMSQIANQRSIRHLEKVPDVRLGDAYVVSGCQVTHTPGTLNYSVSPGVVSFGGTLYNIPAFSASAPSNGTVRIGAQVGGTAPNGYTLPCIVPLPSYTGISTLYAQNVYDFGANGLVAQTNFVGIEIAKIGALNGAIIATTDERALGGVSGLNLVPIPAGTTGSPTLGTVSVNPEGAASASASITATAPSSWVNQSWMRGLAVLVSVAGANVWSTAYDLPPLTSAALSFIVHGLAAGQGYDVALEPVPFNSTPGSVYLLGTSPTVSSTEVTAAILEYTEFPGGKLQADGSLTNVDGALSNTSFQVSNGDIIAVSGIIAKNLLSGVAGFRIEADAFNYYELSYDGFGQAYVYYVFANNPAVLLTSAPAMGNDLNEHTFRFTFVKGSPSNLLEASFDTYSFGVVSNGTITPSSVACRVLVGNSSGTLRRFTFSKGAGHYYSLPGQMRQVINSSGQIPTSTPLKNQLPNTIPWRSNTKLWVAWLSGQNLTYWIDDGGGSGGNPSIWNPDGTTVAGVVNIGGNGFNARTGGISVAGSSGWSSAYFCVYFLPGSTGGVNGTGWYVTVQSTQFGANDASIAAAYADGGYTAILASTNPTANQFNIGSAGGKGGGGHFIM